MKPYRFIPLLTITLLFFLSINLSTAQAAVNFKDVSSKDFYREAVKSFVEKGYITGFSDNTFRPKGNITREQAAIIFSRVLHLEKPRTSRQVFNDVPTNATYAGEIHAVSNAGIMNGYPDGSFKPNRTLSRGEMALIISRTYELHKIQLVTNPFTDTKGTIYDQAVQKLYSANITKGMTATRFAPNNPVTRGEFVTILHRTLQVLKDKTGFEQIAIKQGSGNAIQVTGRVDESYVNSVEVTINQLTPQMKFIQKEDYRVTNKQFNHSIRVPEEGEYEVVVKIKDTGVSYKRTVIVGKIDSLISGVQHGKLYNTDITIEYTLGNPKISRNGEYPKTFKSGTTFSNDGDYILYYEASKDDVKEIHFTIDKTNPVVTGVQDGRTYYGSVNIFFNEGKAILKSGKSKGTTIYSGMNVQEKGDYELVVTDSAGNETKIQFKIEQDDTGLTGVVPNGVYKGNVRPTFKGGTATIRKNGGVVETLKSGTTLSDEGWYYLEYINADGRNYSYYFDIDKTAPVISGVENKGVYNPSVVIAYNEGIGMLEKNKGKIEYFPSGGKVTEPGDYVLTVADKAGNTSVVSFTIDQTLPIVEGVVDKGIYTKPVTIKFKNGTATLKKDSGVEAPVESGSTVSAPGVYTLTVTGENKKKIVMTFIIDSGSNVVAGVENNKVYNRNVTVYFTNRTAWLSHNGGKEERIYSGRVISKEGSYVLTLIDSYNNKTVVNFAIDKTSPTRPEINVAGRQLYGSELVLTDYSPVQMRIKFNTTGSGRVEAGDKLSYTVRDGREERINTEVTLTEADIKNGYKDFFIPSDLLQAMVTNSSTSYNCYITAYLTDKAGNRSTTASRTIKITFNQ